MSISIELTLKKENNLQIHLKVFDLLQHEED